jgi:GNAT superfamily N-acetyltransferase
MTDDLVVHALTVERLGDLATLFGQSKTTSGCYCMWNIASAKENNAGWSGGNRLAFEALAEAAPQPLGLLAYRHGDPVGWVAVGPRTRYQRALGTPTLAGRAPAEDARVWLVTCFYVRRDARRAGVTRALLNGAVALARRQRATAIEGWPLAGDGRHPAGQAYVGVEPLFASCGFTATHRPSAARVIMRLDLAGRGKRSPVS